MKKVTLDSAPRVPFDLDGKFLFQSAKNEIVHISLKPDEFIQLHTNPFDVVFFIIEGMATLTTDQNLQLLNPNETIFIPKSVNRGLANKTDKILRLLVFKIF